MAYGLQVFSHTGASRLFDGDWTVKFHSYHSVYIPSWESRNVYINGYAPGRWGFDLVEFLADKGDEYASQFSVQFFSGRIKLSAGNSGLTCRFNIFKE